MKDIEILTEIMKGEEGLFGKSKYEKKLDKAKEEMENNKEEYKKLASDILKFLYWFINKVKFKNLYLSKAQYPNINVSYDKKRIILYIELMTGDLWKTILNSGKLTNKYTAKKAFSIQVEGENEYETVSFEEGEEVSLRDYGNVILLEYVLKPIFKAVEGKFKLSSSGFRLQPGWNEDWDDTEVWLTKEITLDNKNMKSEEGFFDKFKKKPTERTNKDKLEEYNIDALEEGKTILREISSAYSKLQAVTKSFYDKSYKGINVSQYFSYPSISEYSSWEYGFERDIEDSIDYYSETNDCFIIILTVFLQKVVKLSGNDLEELNENWEDIVVDNIPSVHKLFDNFISKQKYSFSGNIKYISNHISYNAYDELAKKNIGTTFISFIFSSGFGYIGSGDGDEIEVNALKVVKAIKINKE
jgi:hypothetical protein